VPPEEILRYEEAIRSGSYAALEAGEPDNSIGPCSLGENCLSLRSVGIRAGAPVSGLTWEELGLEGLGVGLVSLRRRGAEIAAEPERQRLLPGDEVTIEGTAASFAEAAPLFAASGSPPALSDRAPQRADWIDTEKPVDLEVKEASACGHLGEIREVHPSAAGCEDCLRTGDRWVHLRACMICGHMGCCDSSPNRHATRHYEAAAHPIMRSMERGESWGWCYVDRLQL
jgi:CPA2 family monovalent cation:H+ antiporter-2